MAHLFSFAKNESAYYEGRYSGDRVQFSDTETFEDFQRPHRLVGGANRLMVVNFMRTYQNIVGYNVSCIRFYPPT
jgi:hypothetical protein